MKNVTSCGELFPDRGEVVDLAVEDAGQPAVRRAHGLRTSLDVEHRQPAVTERHRPVAIVAFGIRAAMAKPRGHADQHFLRQDGWAQIAREAAHEEGGFYPIARLHRRRAAGAPYNKAEFMSSHS